ncbi:hypothetical protein HDV01_002111 [Terramyces sp. JEL0728]|nr:hypothetical protein HDV01_002111 [Terramyces sp. JEL0728]
MTRIPAVDLLWILILTAVLSISLYFVYHINFRKTAVKSFVVEFNLLLVINCTQCALLLLWIVLYYANVSFWNANNVNIIQIGAIIVSLQLWVIFLTDVEILRVFSILNENITNTKLNIIKRLSVLVYALVVVYTTMPLFVVDEATNNMSNILLGLFAVLVAFYDNVQTMYLGHLIFGYKRKKTKTDSTLSLVNEFKSIIKFNLVILIMDWFGLFLYGYSTVDTSGFSAYYAVASLVCSSIHTLGMVKILERYAKISIEKKKGKPKKDDTVL